LQAETQTVGGTTSLVDQVQVLVVYVKEAGELLLRRFASVAAIGPSLLFCEKSYGHFRVTFSAQMA